MVQEEGAGNRVVVGGEWFAEQVDSEEVDLGPGVGPTPPSRLDGDETTIAPGDLQPHARAPGLPPESQRHVAGAGRDVEDADAGRPGRPRQLTQTRPEDAGTPADGVDPR